VSGACFATHPKYPLESSDCSRVHWHQSSGHRTHRPGTGAAAEDVSESKVNVRFLKIPSFQCMCFPKFTPGSEMPNTSLVYTIL